MNHEHYLDLAKECSERSDYTGCSGVHVGCVFVYHGTVLAKGWNSDKTHTFQREYNKIRFSARDGYYPDKLHAESAVLQRVKYLDIDFSKATLYIYRGYKNGTPAMARCCPSCMAAAKSLHIGTIVYTTDAGYAIEKLQY